MKTVLVTGFEPFGGDRFNPSAEIARALDGQVIEGRRVVGAVLPCVFGEARAALKRLLASHQPQLVVCVGQAGGRAGISLERVAINVDDARIPDNLGAQPIDEPIAARGPVGYWSTLPIKAIVGALREAGLPAEVSQTAGTFVCNHLFYGLMHLLAKKKKVRGGFVHVPYVPAQARGKKAPSLKLEEQVRALELVVRTALKTKRDVRLGAGATH